MFYRVLMHIIQSRQVRFLVSQLGIPEVVPHLAPWRIIQSIDPAGGALMEHGQHLRQAVRVSHMAGRICNKVVMIRKHRPSFELPREVARYGEKSALENGEAARYAKMVSLKISASGHKVSAVFRKLMSGCMWPGCCRIGHCLRLSALGLNDNDFPRQQIESGGEPPHSKTWPQFPRFCGGLPLNVAPVALNTHPSYCPKVL